MQTPAGRGPTLAAWGLGLTVVGVLIIGLGGLVLAWDGAWFVVRTLETGTPTFLHGRLVGWVVQAPLLVARSLTGDPTAFATIAGLVYAAVPVIALLATWRVTRPDRDDLAALSILGIGMASLGGLAFLISEAMMAVALGWPLIVAAALGRLGRHRWLAVGLIGALAVAHPFGVPILGLAAVAIAVRAIDHPAERPVARRMIAGLLLLAALLGVRYLALSSGYEGEATDPGRLGAQFRGGLAGAPLVAIAGALALGLLLVVRPRADRGGLVLVLGTGIVVAVVMVVWAADPARWERALMFRTFVLFSTLPLYGLAILASRHSRPTRGLSGAVMAVSGLVLIAVATAQTLAWRTTLDALQVAVAAQPAGCVEAAALPIAGSALDHWGVTALSLILEDAAPAHLIAYGTSCEALDAAGGIPLKVIDGAIVDRVPPDGWLDLRALADALRSEAAPAAP
jgi:hypothetical protein